MALFSAPLYAGAGDPTPGMFPFVMPGLSPAGGITDMSYLNSEPAGASGFIRVSGEHFTDGKSRRVKFFGVNFTFASCFPSHEDAGKLAARLASLGINCVRFHHMDSRSAPYGIWKSTGTMELSTEQLDRLDYFIYQLKLHGIYADLNLHVGSNYWDHAELDDRVAPKERATAMPKYCKGLDNIDDRMIALQRDYAKALLSHLNPYTKTAYSAEPSVALVEINNENTLFNLDIDALPDYYKNEIAGKWNRWLKKRYGSNSALAHHWKPAQSRGEDILPKNWTLEQHGDKFYALDEEPGQTRISILKIPPSEYYSQLHRQTFLLEEGKTYTFEFESRSDAPQQLRIGVGMAQADWHGCGLSQSAKLSDEWKRFSYTFTASKTLGQPVRLNIVLGRCVPGNIWLRNLALREGDGPALDANENLSNGNVRTGDAFGSAARREDWLLFLSDTELAYASAMRYYLKHDLGVRANIVDTQASYGGAAGAYREAKNDYVDMHAYWQHPVFPGKPWDRENWYIGNTPMEDSPDGGTFKNLAAYRVADLPFTVSEYNHPAPSNYAADMYPLLSSFAALQDWDAVFEFDYGPVNWESGMVDGFFSLEQHPGKLAFMPQAALVFRKGLVQPADGWAELSIPVKELGALSAARTSVADIWKNAGVTPDELVKRRFALRFTQGTEISLRHGGNQDSRINWDMKNGIYTVDTPYVQTVSGRCTGRTTELSAARFVIDDNPHSFAALTLAAMDEKPLAASGSILLTAAGNVENTAMEWNPAYNSVGTKWGSAPTLCEGITARISLNTTAHEAEVYALGPDGKRKQKMDSTLADGKLSFAISPQYGTIWYEIAAR